MVAETTNQGQPVVRTEPSWVIHAITALPLLAFIVTTGWTAITYFNNVAVQNRAAEINRSMEIRKPYLQKQFDLYIQASLVIGNLIAKPAGTAMRMAGTNVSTAWKRLFILPGAGMA